MDDQSKQEEAQEDASAELHCENCSFVLQDRFCSHCGQDSRPFQRSLGSILIRFGLGFFDLDGKVLRSIFPLLTSPGKLTIEFLNGKRRSQVNPFQLYAFFSFLFFLTAFHGTSDIPTGSSLDREGDTTRISAQIQKACVEVFKEYGSKSLVLEYDSIQNSLPEQQRHAGPVRYFRRTMRGFADKLRKDPFVVVNLFNNMKANIPNSMILLLPFFALMLKMLYMRRHFFYIDHLVFSIHIFCFYFIAGMVSILFGMFDLILPIFFLVSTFYTLIAMKRIYRQSWVKTILKFIVSTVGFSLICFLALMMNFFVSIFFQL
jgi:hypothetical protein